jgi:hypothetical protein
MICGLIIGGACKSMWKYGGHSKELQEVFKKYYMKMLLRGGTGEITM